MQEANLRLLGVLMKFKTKRKKNHNKTQPPPYENKNKKQKANQNRFSCFYRVFVCLFLWVVVIVGFVCLKSTNKVKRIQRMI